MSANTHFTELVNHEMVKKYKNLNILRMEHGMELFCKIKTFNLHLRWCFLRSHCLVGKANFENAKFPLPYIWFIAKKTQICCVSFIYLANCYVTQIFVYLSIYPALQINIPLPVTMNRKIKKTTSQIKFFVVTIK